MELLSAGTSEGLQPERPHSPTYAVSTKMTPAEKNALLAMASQRTWVIDPRKAKWMVWWDMIMIAALLFTATITPYQVAFLPAPNVLENGPDALWIINRLFDVFFITDVLLVCNTAYQEPLIDGGRWIFNHRMIFKEYLKSGFLLIDFVSCFPYFLIGLIVEAVTSGQNNGTGLMPLRLVKLIRMLKLTRCFKASAKVGPYIQEIFMGKLEMTYARLTVCQLFLALIFFTHLQACMWALFSSFTDDGGRRPTWMSEYTAYHKLTLGTEPTPSDMYVASLYWSAMTITSIGYGEMLPVNSAERVVCSMMMLVSGMVWTFILSTAAGIAATLNPNKVLFQNTMDQVRTQHLVACCLCESLK